MANLSNLGGHLTSNNPVTQFQAITQWHSIWNESNCLFAISLLKRLFVSFFWSKDFPWNQTAICCVIDHLNGICLWTQDWNQTHTHTCPLYEIFTYIYNKFIVNAVIYIYLHFYINIFHTWNLWDGLVVDLTYDEAPTFDARSKRWNLLNFLWSTSGMFTFTPGFKLTLLCQCYSEVSQVRTGV